MLITKQNGEQEEFRSGKLRESLRRAGASSPIIERIVSHIESELIKGTTTTDIYRHAFALLEKEEPHPVAARYSLKRAVSDLGPSGFPFEYLLAEIFKARGYTSVETGVVMEGKCAQHEVDIVAQNKTTFVIVEAKFHNKSGFKTDLKVALYIYARSKDLADSDYGGKRPEGLVAESWLVTNTKFTRNATRYAKCQGLKLVGWSYPHKDNLEQLIEGAGLHPLTCLTTLSRAEKRLLFERGTVLCRSITHDDEALLGIGLGKSRVEEVLTEAKMLCKPRQV